ncbi:hypothetical protein [Tabrizicola sp.]|uniref:hypothetical protein n=1 Tax=Tabrizicola sp. TaxID=2005166 RepID=UPI002736552E|nr:hypothetical protein [Tabrizicola sp.]MDP3193926.1 hypothetical protein [Tabrizicola sp.]
MTSRYDTSLRAEPRAAVHTVPATPGGLIRSTLLAAGAAGAVLVLFWLPAEYGIDPTGMGRLTGLTEMGEIKQQLAAEADADAMTAAASAPVPTAPVVAAPEILARLDRIDAQLAAIAAVIGTSPSSAASAPETPIAAPPDPVEAAVAGATTPDWRDEVSYTLNAGEGIEVKLAMQEGQTARYEWTANGGVVNFDLHGDGGGQKLSYEQGRAVPEQTGELTAAFTGNHGWFWRNRSDAPVRVTLRTGGDYQELRAP